MEACTECVEQRSALAGEFRKLLSLFAALGNETRQRILLTLLESTEMGLRVGEVAEKAHLSRPAASHHLRILREAGAVGVCREGTRNYYFPRADSGCWEALRVLTENICAVTKQAAQEGYPHFDEESII